MALLFITPPEYFPGLQVLAAAANAEVVVLADTYQYVRQSRQNRTAVRTPDGKQWLTVPLRNGQHGRAIDACEIADDGRWRARHLKALRFNYGQAAFYEHYLPEIEEILLRRPLCLAALTVSTTKLALRLLTGSCEVLTSSSLPGRPSSLEAVCECYPEHSVLLTEGQVAADAPRLTRPMVSSLEAFSYRQAFDGFEAGLSGLDLLLNHGPGAIQILAQHHSIRELQV